MVTISLSSDAACSAEHFQSILKIYPVSCFAMIIGTCSTIWTAAVGADRPKPLSPDNSCKYGLINIVEISQTIF